MTPHLVWKWPAVVDDIWLHLFSAKNNGSSVTEELHTSRLWSSAIVLVSALVSPGMSGIPERAEVSGELVRVISRLIGWHWREYRDSVFLSVCVCVCDFRNVFSVVFINKAWNKSTSFLSALPSNFNNNLSLLHLTFNNATPVYH